MSSRIFVVMIAGTVFVCCVLPTLARSSPAPAPTPAPLFTYSGDLRAFYFGRTNGNVCLTCKTAGTPDATAFNTGVQLHGQLNIPHSGFSLAGTYFGAYPFGANAPGPLNNAGYNPQVDNTLPGYALSLWGEYYAQYKSPGFLVQSGREIINTPWANASDSRVLPEAFQGTLASANITSDLNLGVMYMARFRSRVTSAFNSNTLLTSCNTAYATGKGPLPNVKGTFSVPGDPCNLQQTTSGFGMASLAYKVGNTGFSLAADQYEVYGLASLTWVTAQWSFAKTSKSNPYLAGQYLSENSTGSAFAGTVRSRVSGGQFGVTLMPAVSFTLGYDGIPINTSVVPAAACKGTPSKPVAPAQGVIFGGVAETSVSGLPKGDVQCLWGGIASPYTDSLATDPLYSTSISQGLADVHKPGTGIKAGLAWTSSNSRLRLLVSEAWYDYWLPGFNQTTSNVDYRAEFDADLTVFLNPVRAGKPYKGFSIRQRYADRTQTFTPYDFKYSRTQLEYSF